MRVGKYLLEHSSIFLTPSYYLLSGGGDRGVGVVVGLEYFCWNTAVIA